ncbi:MAG: FAD-binding protein, partial [Planctomycetales bacterium]|nr:FAD-binding protein [Planctomycetales bacterium]
LIGVRLVNGDAQLVRGGGLVVKNAAGFDIPKLMVGSLGRWGVLAELTFKVFPAAEAAVTLHIDLAGAESAVAVMNQLAGSAEQLDCLDFQPPGRVTVRIRGTRPALPARVQRLRRLVSPEAQVQQIDEDQGYWRDVREFAWVGPQQTLVKVPLAPPQILKMEGKLARIAGDVPRRYSAGGNVAWIAWPTEAGRDELEGLLAQLDSRGLILRGRGPAVLVPEDRSSAFAERLLSVFDPAGKFER